jgi:multiple inositol-polyphosphate phosphatase / 2,3-bisphosphoglycerate 3-phosphatase
MKQPFINLVFWILAISWHFDIVNAQSTDTPPVPLGTKTCYQPAQKAFTAAPAGYKPVFLNYVGRHGARFLTKPEGDVQLYEVLEMADSRNALTARGQLLRQMVKHFLEIEKNNYGNITQVGAGEQKGIAGRMFEYNKSVFLGRGIEVTMTEEVRTEQSAKAFLTGLGKASHENKMTIRKIPDSLNDKLRFYDICPGYLVYKKSPEVMAILDSLKMDPRTSDISVRLANEVFSPDFAADLLGGKIKIKSKQNQFIAFQPEWLTEDLYSLYSIHFSMQMEMKERNLTDADLDFGSYFDYISLRWINFKSAAADFLLKGPGTDSLGVQVINSAPLLVDFIKTTDSAIGDPDRLDARLRFAHAETISPLAALMNIEMASTPSESIFNFDKVWNNSEIIPLSANIQWILYSNGRDYLVKFLLNEKEVSVPVETANFPYYRWENVRNYYLQKLKKLQVSLAADTHRYLLQLH